MERVNQILKNPMFIDYMKKNEALEVDRIYCHHDVQHSLDAARIAYIIALEDKLDTDKELIYAAGLLHDIGRWMEYERGIDHGAASTKLADEILQESGFSEGEITEILHAVSGHREKEGSSTLGDLLYSADKLSRNCTSCKAIGTCKRFQKGENPYLLY